MSSVHDPSFTSPSIDGDPDGGASIHSGTQEMKQDFTQQYRMEMEEIDGAADDEYEEDASSSPRDPFFAAEAVDEEIVNEETYLQQQKSVYMNWNRLQHSLPHPPTPRQCFTPIQDESSSCSPDHQLYASTDEYDWKSVMSESEKEIPKAECPLSCGKENRHSKETVIMSDVGENQHGKETSALAEEPFMSELNAKMESTEIDQRGPSDHTRLGSSWSSRMSLETESSPLNRSPEGSGKTGRSTHCLFRLNGLFFLRFDVPKPLFIRRFIKSILSSKNATNQYPPKATRLPTIQSLASEYCNKLDQLDMDQGTHSGVKRFMEGYLLASLDLGDADTVSALGYSELPRLVLHPDPARNIAFHGRIRSAIPDLVYGYNYKAFVERDEDLNWRAFASPLPEGSSQDGHYKKWVLFKLKQDSGGHVLFPFLSFEYRGLDGDDGCGDSNAKFNRRRRMAGCLCCRNACTTGMGTAELECMATATASIRIVERLNRRLRTKWILQTRSHQEDPYESLLFETVANSSRGIHPVLQKVSKTWKAGEPKAFDHSEAKLLRKYNERKKMSATCPLPVPAMAFSVAVSATEARVFLTWRGQKSREYMTQLHRYMANKYLPQEQNCDENLVWEDCHAHCPVHKSAREYYTAKVANFLMQDPEQHMKFRWYLEAIFTWGVGERLRQIEAILNYI